ncbi:MAG TPA: hypothetical protein VF103_00810, partial [Polyangiaceae bacterium]
SSQWSVYAGGGGGFFAGIAGESEEGAGAAVGGYYYARAGVATRLGIDRSDQIGIDGGFWRGTAHDNGPFFIPMAGLFWLRPFK